jgi:predicted nucleic acid-binding Zn ribbon protein
MSRQKPRSPKAKSPREGPELLGNILAELFVARGWGRRQERSRLESAWSAVVGAEQATQTRIGRLVRGLLEVQVSNGVLLQELAGFHKRRLLEQLRGRLPDVTIHDIRFRAGTWDGPDAKH